MEKHSYSNALERAFLLLEEKNIDSSVATYLLEEMLGWTHTKFILHKEDPMSDDDYEHYFNLIGRAINNEPPQYILGNAWFYGREFDVTEATLIPRQETEELVSKVLSDIKEVTNKLDILDVGTGTGDIPITLALEDDTNNYWASDISASALQVAQKNATNFSVDVKFVQSDLFDNFEDQKFDVIVSNPPYISETERDVMDQSVLDYEPDLALFAEDDGLAFYKNFFEQVDNYLKQMGTVYLEFGYHQKNQLDQIITEQLPHFGVEFYQDLTGNWRYLKMYRKESN